MIHIKNLTLSFGLQQLYDHISCTINQDDRIGLIGRNGSGKSTLLQLIARAVTVCDDAITISKNKTVAYFPQEVVLQSDKSIFDETFSALERLSSLMQEAQDLEKILENNVEDVAALERYTIVQEQLLLMNPHRDRTETYNILQGLGFTLDQCDEPVAHLSVGWKMRIVLAKLLLQKADFYLFDEPTNHLDIVAKEWFLNFLQHAPFGFMIVCHERYFLNAVCTKILELELGHTKMYMGNYTRYEENKAHDSVLLEAAYVRQQKEIKEKQETINRFRAQASKAKMVQSMMRALEKVERIVLPALLKDITISIPPVKPSARLVMHVQDVAYSFAEKQLFSHITFDIERGDKIALIAPNGAGKSTLFNLIAGVYPLQQGKINFGTNVQYAVFDQDQTAALPLEKTIIQALNDSSLQHSESALRALLGSFLFSRDDVNKKIGVLSGGEKNRVGMIKVLLHNANFLLLDEPTNHLDIPSKETLLKALQQYQGTILFVSHDQDFINKLATKIFELTPHGVVVYYGDYDSYRYQKHDFTNNAQAKCHAVLEQSNREVVPHKAVSLPLQSDHKKIRVLERRIDTIEKSIQNIEMDFIHLIYGTFEFSQAQEKLKTLKEEHKLLMHEWEILQEGRGTSA